MILKTDRILSAYDNRLKRVVLRFVFVGLFIGFTGLFSFSLPGIVYAGGGGGSGGGGGDGCSVGPCTSDGWTWGEFNVDSTDEGPSYIFGNGTDVNNGSTTWSSIISECQGYNATEVYAFVISDNTGATGIYNYTAGLSTGSGGPEITGNPVDADGSGTVTSISDAQTQFDKFKSTYGSNLTFGKNVGWFCADYPSQLPSWTVKATGEAAQTAAPKGSVTFKYTLKNTGPDDMNPTDLHYKYSEVGGDNPPVPDDGSTYYDISNGLNNGASKDVSSSFTIPSNATNGTTYCQAIVYYPVSDNKGSIDNNYNNSTQDCVTVKTSTITKNPQPTQGSADFSCTSATLTTPSAWYNGDTTGRYAIYESPAGSMPNPESGTGDVYGTTLTSAWTTSKTDPNDPIPNGTPPWPNTGMNALPGGYATGISPSDTITYNLSPSQLHSGTVQWYVVMYNALQVNSKNTRTVKVNGKNQTQYQYVDTPTFYVASGLSQSVSNCFSPMSCNVNVYGTWGSNDTESGPGQQFSFNVSVIYDGSNDADDPLSVDGGAYPMVVSYTYRGAPYSEELGSDLPGGYSASTAESSGITVNTPTEIGSDGITASISYPGTSLGTLANCTANTVNYFAPFSYTGTSDLDTLKTKSPDVSSLEDVNYVKKAYTYTYTNNVDSSVTPNNLNINGQLTYIPAGQPESSGTVVENDNITGTPQTEYYTVPGGAQSLNAGDGYCIDENITPSDGFVGPGGSTLDNYGDPAGSAGYSPDSFSTQDQNDCSYIQNEPYVSFTGNDVLGDTSFDSVCGEPSDSGIYTNSTDSSTTYSPPSSTAYAGSGGSASQFGAEAVDIIEGLTSATERSSSPTGSEGLTFANGSDGGAISNSPDGNPMGGEFGYSSGGSSCEPDYYDNDKPLSNNLLSYPGDIDSTLSSAGPVTPTPTNPYDGDNYFSNGSVTIGSGAPNSSVTIGNGAKVTIFVKGNVYIDSNIVFGDAGSGWPNLAAIPSFYIIAKGNIYIAPNVTELDGVYIAQPTSDSSNNTGVIDTCANSDGPYSVLNLYGDGGTLPGCNQQLSVYGAFVDQATLLDRSFSSLRYSRAGENNISSYPTASCGGSQAVSGATTQSDCGAEVFDFSPEVYLSQPSYQPASGPAVGKYDYITSLSPVL